MTDDYACVQKDEKDMTFIQTAAGSDQRRFLHLRGTGRVSGGLENETADEKNAFVSVFEGVHGIALCAYSDAKQKVMEIHAKSHRGQCAHLTRMDIRHTNNL